MDRRELLELLDSWLLRLRAERKSAQTLNTYETGVRGYLDYCQRVGLVPDLMPNTVAAYVGELLDTGRSAGTARLRHVAVRLFSAWLADEGEIEVDKLINTKPPKLDNPQVDSLSDEELAALIKACEGAGLGDRRDEALVRLMLETGLRAGEVVSMRLADVDIVRGLATVVGKGRKVRTVAFGPATSAALDRYIRARRRHAAAGLPWLWLAVRGSTGGLSYAGLHRALGRRAKAAGIKGFHPHRLRHTFASRWLAAGGSEQGLMHLAGWTRRDMLDRYTQDTSARRAHDEARRLALGDV